jgi:integrase
VVKDITQKVSDEANCNAALVHWRKKNEKDEKPTAKVVDLSPDSLTDIPNINQKGVRLGNRLNREQAKELLAVPDRSTLKGKRDYVILALLVGCALRRNELAELDVETIQQREGRWVLADLEGKGPARPYRRHPDLGQAGNQRLDDGGRHRRRPDAAVGGQERQGKSRYPE